MLTRYKHLVIRNFAGQPTALEIKAIEQELKAELPPEFIEFLNVANGGHTDFSVGIPPLNDDSIGFTRLNSTKPDQQDVYSYGTFLYELRLQRQNRKMPLQVLPIAEDEGGSLFYLDLTPEGQGRVVVFRHGLPEWTGRGSEDAFIETAPNFSQFIDRLYIEEDYAKVIWEDALATNEETEIAETAAILDAGLPDWRVKLHFSG